MTRATCGYVPAVSQSSNRNRAQPQKESFFPVDDLIEALSPLKIGIAVFDWNLRYTAVNQQMVEIDGLSIANHLGKTAWQVLGSLADQYELLLRAVFETGQTLMNREIVGEMPGRTETRKWINTFLPLMDVQARVTNVGVFIVQVAYSPREHILFEQVERPLSPSSTQIQVAQGLIDRGAQGQVPKLLDLTQRHSAKLSLREEQVLRLLATGMSNKEVAWELKISVKTVECYRSRLMLKLEARSLAHLIHFAIRHGLVQLQA